MSFLQELNQRVQDLKRYISYQKVRLAICHLSFAELPLEKLLPNDPFRICFEEATNICVSAEMELAEIQS